MNSKAFSLENDPLYERSSQRSGAPKMQRNRFKNGASMKARSKMNLHNNEAGRRVSLHFSAMIGSSDQKIGCS